MSGTACFPHQKGREQSPVPTPGRYLHQSPFVHGTQDEAGVGRPFDVLDLVEARVQLKDLKGVHIPDH